MSADLMLGAGIAAIFVGIVLMLTIIGTVTTERQAIGRSLAAVQAIQTVPDSMRKELDRPFTIRVLLPTVDRFTSLGRSLSPRGNADRIRHRLELAGNPPNWDVDRVLAFKVIGMLVGFAVGAIATFAVGAGLAIAVVVTAGLTVLGLFSPDIVLMQWSQTRQQRIQRELPDALDLLSISVEAGLAFDAALAQVARNTVGPLADEFFRVLQEMQIGTGRADAMRALGDRTTVPELRGFVTAMVQADAFGVPIANVLRVQAAEMRIKRSQRAEEKAQKVPVKILFPLIFCIMPSLFVVILGPAAITIYRNLVHHG